jgi:hypothetical protein
LATLDGMTGAFVSRWPVLEEHPVAAGDLDAGGAVRDDSVARWVAAARSAYLDRCAALRRRQQASGLELQVESASLPPGASLGRRPAAVAVSAGVREVWPSSFAIAVRLRPDGERQRRHAAGGPRQRRAARARRRGPRRAHRAGARGRALQLSRLRRWEPPPAGGGAVHEQGALALVAREGGGALERPPRLVEAAELGEQVAAHERPN